MWGPARQHHESGRHEDDDWQTGADLRTVVNEIRDAQPARSLLDSIRINGGVNADAARLQQLLSSLLGNAIAYGAPATPIGVDALVRLGEAIASVSNSGDVIPPEDLSRLFDAYWRSETRVQGTSMGWAGGLSARSSCGPTVARSM